MQNVGTAASTGEGWSAMLLMVLGVVKQLGWIPADMDNVALVAGVVLLVNTIVFAARKAFRKGSTPFVADAPKPQP